MDDTSLMFLILDPATYLRLQAAQCALLARAAQREHDALYGALENCWEWEETAEQYSQAAWWSARVAARLEGMGL